MDFVKAVHVLGDLKKIFYQSGSNFVYVWKIKPCVMTRLPQPKFLSDEFYVETQNCVCSLLWSFTETRFFGVRSLSNLARGTVCLSEKTMTIYGVILGINCQCVC